MASTRRTHSPAHRARTHPSPFDPSPHQRSSLLSSSSFSSSAPSSSSFSLALRRLVSRALFPPPRRPGQPPSWKRTLRLFLLFFLAGFLLGCSPFANLRDDISPHNFSFDARSPVVPGLLRHGGNRVIETVRPDGIVAVELEARKDPAAGSAEMIPRKLLIVVTPTYNRALQAYYLTRLGQTLRLVKPPLLWIVVEMGAASLETADVLRRTGVMYRHLVCQKSSKDVKDRGVHQRNTALEHIERHSMDGIVYFADDDNIYSLDLFEQMREIRRFGTWPVAMLAQSKSKATLEGPVCNGSVVVGWHTNEKSKRLRRFHVDMSGFAFNSTILWDLKQWRHLTSDPIRQLDTIKEGFQETSFIEQVVEDESQMEAIPSGCSRIMNWHLHLDARGLVYPKGWKLPKNLEAVIPVK